MARLRAASTSSTNSDLSSVPDDYEGTFDKPAGASTASITPATSLPDNASEHESNNNDKRRQSGRARNAVASYNENQIAGTALRRKSLPAKLVDGASTRNISGATLVEQDSPGRQLLEEGVKRLDMEWDLNRRSPGTEIASPGRLQRRQSTRRQLENAASNVASAVANATSALGKRSRDAMESARETLRAARTELQTDTRTRGMTEGMSNEKSDGGEGSSNALSSRLSAFPGLQARLLEKEKAQKKLEEEKARLMRPRTIKSVEQGLYCGMTRRQDSQQAKKKAKGNNATFDEDDFSELDHTWLPLPMGPGERLFRQGRDFKLPFNVLNPLPSIEAPKDWKCLNKNRFIGDAGPTWRKDFAQFERSRCYCKPGTGCSTRDTVDGCVNATMHYECNSENCPLEADQCLNRPFAELQTRARAKNEFRNPEKPEHNLWSEGVEVFKTPDRGHGVRAMRSFTPDQIIVEYCGEIIDQYEADRRMNTDYKDKHNYYLMDFHEGLIIDATRGSLCRFVNHSCEPNCRVEKWSVNGEPRMALFAEKNIDVGQELTYDYNFDPFSKDNIQKCFCGTQSCRGVIGPKPKDQRLKLTKPLEVAIKVAKGVKRKLTKAIGGDVSSDEDQQPSKSVKRRKTLPNPRAILSQAKKQITKGAAAPPALILPDITAQEQNKSRAERLAKRAHLGQGSSPRKSSGKITKRHSESALSIAKLKDSPLPPAKNSRKSTGNIVGLTGDKSLPLAHKSGKSLDKLKETLKKNVSNVLEAAKPSTTNAKLTKAYRGKLDGKTQVVDSRSSSAQHLLKSGSNNSMRQSRLSFTAGNMGLRSATGSPAGNKTAGRRVSSTNKAPATLDAVKAGRVSKTPKSPDTRARPMTARPTTAMSVATSVKSAAVRSVKGPRRALAITRMGLKGDEALKKTIRQVSGADA